MSFERIHLLIRRARGFLEGALFHFRRGGYDIAVFNLEQALQLYLKAVLLKLTGYYPEVHSIRTLLSHIYEQTGDKRIPEFTRRYRFALALIEHAYTGTRYGDMTFDRDTAKRLLNIGVKCLQLVAKATSMEDITK